jgi:hypothetical protein
MSATRCQLFAMKDAGIAIAAVHIDKKYIVFSNGVRLKIRLYDRYDDEVDDPEDAAYYEFGDEVFGFGSSKLNDLADFQEWNQ